MTDIDVYQPGNGITQYQAGIVMTPDQARAMDEQVRLCTEAVLREGTDYGIIPGTNGEKTLWRPGAQKLLQWFRLECICERIEIERDDDGRKHGITYRAEVGRGLKTATPVILATCEGTADYDESKFHQTAEQVQDKLEARERKFAKMDGRVANPTKWKGDPGRGIPAPGEYRADWNALMKRAQKRAIVGAVNDATAAGGIFTDREEDDHAPPPQDDGPSYYEVAIGDALTFTDRDAGAELYKQAAKAHREGLCSRRQQDHIQNTITQRVKLLNTATPVDVEDLAKTAAQDSPRTVRGTAAAGDGTHGRTRNADAPASAQDGTGDTGEPLPPPPAEDEPGDPDERHRRLVGAVQGEFKRLGYAIDDDDREERVIAIARLARVAYDPDKYASTNDFEEDELKVAARELRRRKNRDALDALLKAGEVDE